MLLPERGHDAVLVQLALRRDPGPRAGPAFGRLLPAAVPGGGTARVVGRPVAPPGGGVAPGAGRSALTRHLRRIAGPGLAGPGVGGPGVGGPDVTRGLVAVTE
ncbi:hypothetical protein [Streptomyces sp. BK208]|uniref:hypothetical protein n=1 Tax=Streptomyces sp. BK208 TaxID=2512150 RepID=UPI003264687F